MAVCDNLIKQDITANCDYPVSNGVESKGVIINRSDIDFGAIVRDTNNNKIIKTLPLLTGKRGYELDYPGSSPFTGSRNTLTVGTYVNTYERVVTALVLDHGPDVIQNIIEPLGSGSSFVIILENKSKGENGKSAFEIFGLEQGLVASEQEQAKYSDDYQGGWITTLTETGAKSPSLFLFDTDYATTKAMVDSLTNTPS